MPTTLPKNGINTVPVKPNIEKPKIPSDPTKDESRSFLSISRENLSISHSDIEQGFNRMKPRIRRDTILSIIAILLALFCIGLETWKIQSIVDNAKEIDLLKLQIETMKHKLLEEDLLNNFKAFEEMYAEEGIDDDESGDYDSAYDDDDEDEDEDDDSKFSIPEYLSDYNPEPYTSLTSSSGATGAFSQEDVERVLAGLENAKDRRAREKKEKIEHEQRAGEEAEYLGVEDEEDVTEEPSDDPNSSFIKRKRSTDEEKPLGYNPSGVPIYAHGYHIGSRRNLTRNADFSPRMKLYDTLINRAKVTMENSEEESLLNEPVIPPWDKHPPKKYYAQSRAPVSHVTPPPSYTSRVHNTRQMNTRRSGGRRDEGPQALTRKEGGVARGESESLRAMQNVAGRTTQPLRRRGVTRRHLRSPRQVFAAHYAADSTLFAAEDEHVGNGKGRHHQGVFKAWRPSRWVNDLGMSRHFNLSEDGRLTVQETGLYLIYAQIHYLDQHDENGFQVLVNDQSILQCMVYSPGQEHKSRSCFSAQAALLHSGDHLLLRDVGIDRYTLFQHDKSFFGLVRLGDTNTKAQRQQSQN